MHPLRIYHSPFYGETAGILHEIMKQDGNLVARIGKICLALPLEFVKDIQPLIGQRIAILHTDIPDQSYLFRVIVPEDEQPK